MRNTKGLLIMSCYKVSNFFTKSRTLRVVGWPIRVMYVLIVQWILGVDIPDTVIIGDNLRIYHGQGLIISHQTIIGNNVKVRQNTTIGNAITGGGSPKIGNNVDIGANSVVIGDITIGDNAVIAAGSIVIDSVCCNTLVAGNPAVPKKIKQ